MTNFSSHRNAEGQDYLVISITKIGPGMDQGGNLEIRPATNYRTSAAIHAEPEIVSIS